MRFFLYQSVLILMLIMYKPVLAQDQWDYQKGNCDAIFLTYEKASLVEIKRCVALWESYKDVSKLKDGERQGVARAFKRLYDEGEPADRHLAKVALTRLGFPPTEEPVQKKEEAPKRQKYRAHSATPEAQKAAKEVRKKGYALYEKKRYREALEKFLEATRLDGQFVQAIYDAACCYALLGDRENAIEYLRRLSDLGDKESLARLRKARTDKDFDAIRDDPEFKQVTLYAKIKVINGMKGDDEEIGADNVFKLVEMLRSPKLAWIVDEGEPDKHSRDRPHIWFKSHAKNQALIVKKIIGHPKTRLVPIEGYKDWDTPYDLIVSWADKVVVDKDGVKTSKYSVAKGGGGKGGGIDPEKRVDEALREQDKALREPDQYARKVEDTVATPDRIEKKLDSSVDRTKRTIDNIERAGQKIEKAGDKLF